VFFGERCCVRQGVLGEVGEFYFLGVVCGGSVVMIGWFLGIMFSLVVLLGELRLLKNLMFVV